MQLVSGLEDWANAIVELAPAGPLPERWVIVPNQRVASALVRLLRARAERLLLGTRFLTLVELAREILLDAGDRAELRSTAQDELFVCAALEQLEFEQIDVDVRRMPELAARIARTLDELAAAGVCADMLEGCDAPKLRDLGRIMALREQAEPGSPHALLARAAARARTLEGRPPTLAVVSGDESIAEAELLRALPNLTLACWAPGLPATAARLRLLFDISPELGTDTVSLDDVRPRRARPRTDGRRGSSSERTVDLTAHAGIEAEVDDAVRWLHAQLTQHGRAPHELALLAPCREPYGPLLRARLRAEGLRVRVSFQGGVPLREFGDGVRLARVIAALRDGLSAARLATLLPDLRCTTTSEPLAQRSARALLSEVHTRGGRAGELRAGRAWPEAWEEAITRLQHEERALSAAARSSKRALSRALAGRSEAVEALTDVLRHVIAGAPLSMVWMCLSTFASTQLRRAPKAPLLAALERSVASFEGHEEHEPCGVDALDWLARTIGTGMLDEPSAEGALFVGSFEDARALSFRAVRMLGLSEEMVRRGDREATLLDDAERRDLSPLLTTHADWAARRDAALLEATATARELLALSTPSGGAIPGAKPHPLLGRYAGALARGPQTFAANERRAASEQARVGPGRPLRSSSPVPARDRRALHGARGLRGGAVAVSAASGMACEQPDAAAFDATVRRGLALMLTKRANNPDGATRLAARASGLEERVAVATDHVGRAYDALASAGLLGRPLRLRYELPNEHGSGSSACDVVIAMPRALIAIALVTGGADASATRAARAHARALANVSAGLRVRAASLSSQDGSLRWLE